MTRLFIYGTLKRGQRAHHLLANERFVRLAETIPKYRLLHLGSYPGLAHAPEVGKEILGELWDVSDDCIAILDAYEGLEYERTEVLLSNGKAEAYILTTPDWTCPDAGTEWR